MYVYIYVYIYVYVYVYICMYVLYLFFLLTLTVKFCTVTYPPDSVAESAKAMHQPRLQSPPMAPVVTFQKDVIPTHSRDCGGDRDITRTSPVANATAEATAVATAVANAQYRGARQALQWRMPSTAVHPRISPVLHARRALAPGPDMGANLNCRT